MKQTEQNALKRSLIYVKKEIVCTDSETLDYWLNYINKHRFYELEKVEDKWVPDSGDVLFKNTTIHVKEYISTRLD